MTERLKKDLRPFVDDDQGFIEWCHANPDGFVLNCFRRAREIMPHMLHSAIRHGELCQHFRDRSCAGGMQPHLTDRAYCKVCSLNRKALERWAAEKIQNLKYCSSCANLP